MKKTTKHYLLLCSLGVALVLFFTILLYYLFHPLTRQEISIDLTIGNYIGINVDQDTLHFGTLRPGASAERSLILRADDYDIAVQLIVEDLPFVIPEEETLIIKQGESKAVRFFAKPGDDQEKKTYTGRLIILTKRL